MSSAILSSQSQEVSRLLDPHNSPRQVHPETLLGQVLEGLPSKIQTSLSQRAIAEGVDPGDHIFFAALMSGEHAKLIHDTLSIYPPQFEEFSQELKAWTQQISQLTRILELETKDTAALATNTTKLTVLLTKFIDISNSYNEKLAANNSTLTSSISRQTALLDKLEQSLGQQQQLMQLCRQTLGKSQAKSNRWITAINRVVQVGTGLGVSVLLWFTFTDAQTLITQVDWSLTKLRRIECGLELRKPGTPECHSFQ